MPTGLNLLPFDGEAYLVNDALSPAEADRYLDLLWDRIETWALNAYHTALSNYYGNLRTAFPRPHPGTATNEASSFCLVPLADEEAGEIPKGFVVMKPGADANTRPWCRLIRPVQRVSAIRHQASHAWHT